MKTKTGSPVLEIKALESDGTFSGYGSIFGNIDSHGDIVQPGAFAKSLKRHEERGTRPKLFWQHDMHQPIGSWTSIKEDEKGLYMEGRFNMDVQRGREAYALLKAGDIDGLSIGYRTIKEKRDNVKSANLLEELDLIETSVVSLGSNDLALVDAVKQIRGEELPSLSEFEGFLREAGFSKTEAAAIAGSGLSRLLRSESDSEPVGEDAMNALFAAMSDAEILCVDENGNTVSFEDL